LYTNSPATSQNGDQRCHAPNNCRPKRAGSRTRANGRRATNRWPAPGIRTCTRWPGRPEPTFPTNWARPRRRSSSTNCSKGPAVGRPGQRATGRGPHVGVHRPRGPARVAGSRRTRPVANIFCWWDVPESLGTSLECRGWPSQLFPHRQI